MGSIVDACRSVLNENHIVTTFWFVVMSIVAHGFVRFYSDCHSLHCWVESPLNTMTFLRSYSCTTPNKCWDVYMKHVDI